MVFLILCSFFFFKKILLSFPLSSISLLFFFPKGGVNRHAFLPFIGFLKERNEIFCLDSQTDYRLTGEKGRAVSERSKREMVEPVDVFFLLANDENPPLLSSALVLSYSSSSFLCRSTTILWGRPQPTVSTPSSSACSKVLPPSRGTLT